MWQFKTKLAYITLSFLDLKLQNNTVKWFKWTPSLQVHQEYLGDKKQIWNPFYKQPS